MAKVYGMAGKLHEIACLNCGVMKKINNSNFYKSNSMRYKHIGIVPICKSCIEKEYKDVLEKTNDMRESIIHICKLLDKPFVQERFLSLVKQHKENDPYKFYGVYLRAVSCGPMIKAGYKTFDDSVFEVTGNNITSEMYSSKEDGNDDVNKSNIGFENFVVTDEIINKWGTGYTPEEYYGFEKKYQLLKNHYNQQTAMHTEALLNYIRYRVKEELATARDDVKAAKEWGMLADKAAQAAKINPSQLSPADLSGGLNTFGELTRMVERVDDIIPILPRFKERPQDSVDFTIWCYVNYIREMKGAPRVEYAEIYRYIEERKKEYKDKFDFLNDVIETELEDVLDEIDDITKDETGDE